MRTRPLVVLFTAAAFLMPGLPASADQSYWVPVGGALVVHGHGYGHGHGMSQYGAEGAAQQGLTAAEILAFYYPGTILAQASKKIRVLITADTTPDLVVGARTGLTLTDLGRAATYDLPSRPAITQWRLKVDSSNHERISYFTTAWHRYRAGSFRHLKGDGQFSASGPLTLFTPSGAHAYRGSLRAATPSVGSTDRDTVNVLSLDQYVKGVVPSEMPPNWHPAAVQSQAVAARTYAAWSRAENQSRYYQICDTTACQVYGGVDAEDPLSNAAVDATAGQILTYAGAPAFTQFSASSGGWTSYGGQTYLPAQQDPYDGWSGNHVHDWTVTVSAKTLVTMYPELGRLRRIEVVTRDGNGQWHGRVGTLTLDGTKTDVSLSGDTLRGELALRSTWFSIDPTAIIAYWQSLGGASSPLGQPTSREYRVHRAAVQRFENGRVYRNARHGTWELTGVVLTTYLDRGATSSDLGLPVSGMQQRPHAVRALFEHGRIKVANNGHVTVTVTP